MNGMVERLCKEEDVGYVDLWDRIELCGERRHVREGWFAPEWQVDREPSDF